MVFYSNILVFSSSGMFYVCVASIKKGRCGVGPFDERYQRSNPRLADL